MARTIELIPILTNARKQCHFETDQLEENDKGKNESRKQVRKQRSDTLRAEV